MNFAAVAPADTPPDTLAPAPAAPRWQLQLLGRFRLHDGERVHHRLATRAATALLARLALWPQRDHAREELAELLWPGVDAATGRRRLRQTLSLLKHVLEPLEALEGLQPGGAPVLQASRLHLRLVEGTLRCDVQQFERLARARRPAEAVAVYGGELLPGFYDDWIQDERLRLSALRDSLGDAPPAVTSSPVPAADAAAAVAAAATAATAASTSLADTVALARHAATTLTRDDRSTLPSFLTRYVASAQQLRQLRALVAQQRWVTVVGPGGSGKTRLVVELAQQLMPPGSGKHGLRSNARDAATDPATGARTDPATDTSTAAATGPQAAADATAGADASTPFDRVLFVPLVSASTSEQVLGLVGKALRIAAATPTHDAVAARLAGWKTLLVLDNIEQLLGVADGAMAQLSAACPQLHLLLTSRRCVGVDGEQAFAIAALPLPTPDAGLAALAANPAVALFVDRAAAVRLDFHLGARNAPAVAALVSALQGMPLAIELAASRLRSFSPADMLARLQSTTAAPGSTPQLELLARPHASTGAARDPRHASMQRTIAWSWAQLQADERDLAGTMAVFSGGCSVAMLQQVHGGGDVLLGLEQLLAHSLAHHARGAGQAGTVAPADNGDGGAAEHLRFQLYEPIREHAAAQLAPARAALVRARHRAWVTGWARAQPATPLLAEVRAEVPNIAAALHSARHDGAGGDAAQLLLALGHTREDVELPAAALADAAAAIDTCPDAALRSRGQSAVGPMLFAAGDTPAALRQVDAALAHNHADPALQGHALYAAARLRWRTGLAHPERVLPLVDDADALAASSGDVYLQAGLLSLRAWATQVLDGTPQRALALHQRALQHWLAFGNLHAVHLGRYNVAVFEFECGRPQLALQQLDGIAAAAAVLQDWRRVSVVNNARGTILSALRRWPEALQALRASLHLSWQQMSLYNLAYDLWNLPRALAHARRPAQALTLMTFAERFWQQQYGALTASDRFDLRRVNRLAACQLPPRACAEARAQGQLLDLAGAVALALSEI